MLEIVVNEESLTFAIKEYGNKEESGITTGKKKFDHVFDILSKKLASIKRHFFASPFEMMLEAVAHNEKNKDSKLLPNLSYNLKPNSHEKVWLAFQSMS